MAACARRPAGRAGLSSQSRADLVGDRRTSCARRRGDVLELGSGTGQHAVAFAARSPQLTWWPSDIYPSHLASIEAWRRAGGTCQPACAAAHRPHGCGLDLDGEWAAGAARRHALHQRAAHFALGGVGKSDGRRRPPVARRRRPVRLRPVQARRAAHQRRAMPVSTPSLRAENPEWGVRDIDDLSALAQTAGLTLGETVPMPANNLVLVFTRARRPELTRTVIHPARHHDG